MNIDAIPIGKSPPDDLNVIIEVPLGGEPIKYEIDKASGALFVDRFLYTPMRYPGNYGFIPHTLCGDGDPLDVLVMNSRPLVPGAVVRSRPIGVLFMEDDGGKDEKILAVPAHKLTAMYDKVHDINDIQAIQVEREDLAIDCTRGEPKPPLHPECTFTATYHLSNPTTAAAVDDQTNTAATVRGRTAVRIVSTSTTSTAR